MNAKIKALTVGSLLAALSSCGSPNTSKLEAAGVPVGASVLRGAAELHLPTLLTLGLNNDLGGAVKIAMKASCIDRSGDCRDFEVSRDYVPGDEPLKVLKSDVASGGYTLSGQATDTSGAVFWILPVYRMNVRGGQQATIVDVNTELAATVLLHLDAERASYREGRLLSYELSYGGEIQTAEFAVDFPNHAAFSLRATFGAAVAGVPSLRATVRANGAILGSGEAQLLADGAVTLVVQDAPQQAPLPPTSNAAPQAPTVASPAPAAAAPAAPAPMPPVPDQQAAYFAVRQNLYNCSAASTGFNVVTYSWNGEGVYTTRCAVIGAVLAPTAGTCPADMVTLRRAEYDHGARGRVFEIYHDSAQMAALEAEGWKINADAFACIPFAASATTQIVAKQISTDFGDRRFVASTTAAVEAPYVDLGATYNLFQPVAVSQEFTQFSQRDNLYLCRANTGTFHRIGFASQGSEGFNQQCTAIGAALQPDVFGNCGAGLGAMWQAHFTHGGVGTVTEYFTDYADKAGLEATGWQFGGLLACIPAVASVNTSLVYEFISTDYADRLLTNDSGYTPPGPYAAMGAHNLLFVPN